MQETINLVIICSTIVFVAYIIKSAIVEAISYRNYLLHNPLKNMTDEEIEKLEKFAKTIERGLK